MDARTEAATSSGDEPARGHALGIVAFAVALGCLAFLVWRFLWTCDDAYISFRYARHLAEGHGLRFNLQDEPVEGYSNFLWVLIAAAFERVGLGAPSAMNVVSIVGSVALLAVLARRLAEDTRHAAAFVAALLVYATLPPIGLWSTSGLATLPNALCLFALWDRAHAPRGPRLRALVPLLAVALLLRADAFLWVFGILAAAWFTQRDEPRAARTLLRALVFAAALWLALTGFRLAYFGDWLPNTARVKGGLTPLRIERGLRYVALFLATFPGAAIAYALGVAFGVRPVRERARSRGAPALRTARALVLGTCAYAIWVGGDFMAMGRLLIVALPFATVLLGATLDRLSARRRRPLAATLVVLAAASSLAVAADRYVVPRAWRQALHFRWNTKTFQDECRQWWVMNKRCELWEEVGRFLADEVPPQTSLVAGAIGAIGYHSEVHLYDLHGLVNRLGADAAVSDERRSPGHDREIPIERILALEPDLLNAELIPRTELGYNLPSYLRRGSPHLARARFEYRPTADPNALVRLVWLRDGEARQR